MNDLTLFGMSRRERAKIVLKSSPDFPPSDKNVSAEMADELWKNESSLNGEAFYFLFEGSAMST